LLLHNILIVIRCSIKEKLYLEAGAFVIEVFKRRKKRPE
jgi:hypothetical protein